MQRRGFHAMSWWSEIQEQSRLTPLRRKVSLGRTDDQGGRVPTLAFEPTPTEGGALAHPVQGPGTRRIRPRPVFIYKLDDPLFRNHQRIHAHEC